MAFRQFRTLCVIAVLAGFSSGGHSQSRPASLRPHEDKRQTDQLESGPSAAAAQVLAGLLNCVNALARGQFSKGEAACSGVIALDSKNANAFKLRGYGYLLEHRFELAAADFQVALRLEPSDAESLAGYGQSLSGQGRFEAAVAEFSKAIMLAPKAAPYWNARCWARAGGGRQLSVALADCNRALALSPAAAGALNSRGMVRLRLGQFQTAIVDYSSSLVINPKQPSAQFGRGMALLHLGRADKAAIDIAQARQADPDIDDLFVLMGVLPHDCARPGKAICPPPATRQEKADRPLLLTSTPAGENDFPFAAEASRLRLMREYAIQR